MCNHHDKKSSETASLSVHCTLYTVHSRSAITLIEVLAAIFVISIGLLGVLAVIPFGIFQVSKARDAEHTANMLAAAEADIKITGMTLIGNWASGNGNGFIKYGSGLPPGLDKDGDGKLDSGKGGNGKWSRTDLESAGITLDCSRFFVVDPLGTAVPTVFPSTGNPGRLTKMDMGTPIDYWREIMRGQDDLVFTTHRTRLSRAIERRTDFSGQHNVVASSGKYTWFYTFAIVPENGFTGSGNRNNSENNITQVGVTYWPETIAVDMLGCYNRAPDDPVAEREVDIDETAYTPTLNGAQITLSGTEAELDLSKTKCIFVMWTNGNYGDNPTPPTPRYEGTWCKIAYAPKNRDRNGAKTIVVIAESGTLPASWPTNADPKALIVDGVVYHKRVDGLPLF